MNCPQCRQENPPQAKFCMECAAPLIRACTQCQTQLPAAAKFCPECAHPVSAQPTREPEYRSPETYTPKHLAEKILTSKSALEGERKQVTVLFADLKGSMELLADRDPEEARTLLNAVVERMMEAVHRYEGTVNNVMGDGIMAIFGAPVAHEDHALRACYATITMQESIQAYNEEVRRSHGISVLIRIGLNSGEVVVGNIGNDLHMDYNAIGETTHLAARMEQLAPPGGIRLTDNTMRLVAGLVQVNPLGPIPVKGLLEPVETFQLLSARAVRRRLGASGTRSLSPLVGRQSELEVLRHAVEQAASGRGQVVALVGEAGVGKSRLFWEFTHSHRTQSWQIHGSGSVSYGKATAYLPLIELLKSYFQIEDGDDSRKMREKITGKLLTLDKALESTLPAFLSLLDLSVDDSEWQGLDPPQRRSKTLDAVKGLLLRESRQQPLCLIFEDLHWIDSETQAFLDSLIESLPTNKVLFLVNYRPEYQHSWGSKSYYTQLRVDPLPPESAEELLEGLLGTSSELVSLTSLLIERTQGNPFFLEESVQALIESEVLVGAPGSYHLVKPLETITVPATVQAVLAARIDRLGSEEKRLLQTAAVLGKDVPFVLLQEIVEEFEEDTRSRLNRLQVAEFIYETQLFPELEYTFKHALTHQVAYEGLLQERRRALHAKIVEALERLQADRLGDQVEKCAHHALQGELWDKAATYLQEAGTKAFAHAAYSEAAVYFEQALTALAHLPETEENLRQGINIRAELGPILMLTKGFGAPEVYSCYNHARELCERIGETSQLCPVLWGLARVYDARGDLEGARRIEQQLLSLAQRLQDPALLLQANHSLWTTSLRWGELATAQSHLEQGFKLYDCRQHRHLAKLYGGHDAGVCCRFHSALTLWLLGYPDQGLEHVNDALRLARELSHLSTLAIALYNAVWIHQLRGDVRAAQELTEALVALATEHGVGHFLTHGRFMQGWLMIEQGRGREGIELMRRNNIPSGRVWPYFAALLAEAYQKEGQEEEGLGEVTKALTRVDKTGDRFYEAELNRIKGVLVLQQAGSAEKEAERFFREAIYISRHQEAKSLELRAATSLGRLLRQQGKSDQAREMLTEIYGWFTEGVDTSDLKEAKVLLDELS